MAEKKNYVLGLDLGTNSLGWVAIEIDAKENPLGLLTDMTREGALPSMGVRIFEAGVDGVGMGEKEVVETSSGGWLGSSGAKPSGDVSVVVSCSVYSLRMDSSRRKPQRQSHSSKTRSSRNSMRFCLDE